MTLNKDQRKKFSDICEKIGIVLLIASIGEAIVAPDSLSFQELGKATIGTFIGIGLLIISIFVLRGD